MYGIEGRFRFLSKFHPASGCHFGEGGSRRAERREWKPPAGIRLYEIIAWVLNNSFKGYCSYGNFSILLLCCLHSSVVNPTSFNTFQKEICGRICCLRTVWEVLQAFSNPSPYSSVFCIPPFIELKASVVPVLISVSFRSTDLTPETLDAIYILFHDHCVRGNSEVPVYGHVFLNYPIPPVKRVWKKKLWKSCSVTTPVVIGSVVFVYSWIMPDSWAVDLN